MKDVVYYSHSSASGIFRSSRHQGHVILLVLTNRDYSTQIVLTFFQPCSLKASRIITGTFHVNTRKLNKNFFFAYAYLSLCYTIKK